MRTTAFGVGCAVTASTAKGGGVNRRNKEAARAYWTRSALAPYEQRPADSRKPGSLRHSSTTTSSSSKDIMGMAQATGAQGDLPRAAIELRDIQVSLGRGASRV